MIVEYDSRYDNDIKELFVELQEHIVNIDKEHFNIVGINYGEEYFKKTMEEINSYEGKMLLYKNDDKIAGLIVGLINNDDMEEYDFKAPKRGRISELVVSSKCRSNGIGAILLNAMEDYLKSVGCKNILIGVFAYNEGAINFYERHGYHTRMTEMVKSIED